MPQLQLTLVAGTDFDGTVGQGLLDFSTILTEISDGDDSVRALVMNIGVSAPAGGLEDTTIRLAPAGSVIGDLGYVQLAKSDDATGVSLYGCNITVPRAFDFQVYTTELAAVEKQLIVDWRAIRIMPRSN